MAAIKLWIKDTYTRTFHYSIKLNRILYVVGSVNMGVQCINGAVLVPRRGLFNFIIADCGHKQMMMAYYKEYKAI